MYQTVRALVLRFADYKERGRILTVLTDEGEKLTVSAHSRNAYTEPFVCSELMLRKSKGKWYVTEGRTVSEFRGIRNELGRFDLAAHIARLLEAVSDADVPDPELFRLGANALNALAKTEAAQLEEFKTAVEARIARIAGFADYGQLEEILTGYGE
ncbi:MAG: recombination protein O N-terminal domain-containing protein [Oscillospiraceae bacterium]|jgi:DNA repair protein RecO|nr:recombination protein O N-terminal domain-containing protein [Oscillospiraceae bacterium]